MFVLKCIKALPANVRLSFTSRHKMSSLLDRSVSFHENDSQGISRDRFQDDGTLAHSVSLNMQVFMNNVRASPPPEYCGQSIQIRLSGSNKSFFANRLILCLASNGFTGMRSEEDLEIPLEQEKALVAFLECLHKGTVALGSREEVRDLFEVASNLGVDHLVISSKW